MDRSQTRASGRNALSSDATAPLKPKPGLSGPPCRNGLTMLNPYVQEGNPPTTQKSVVAFLDVLGFSQRMKDAYEQHSAAHLLTEFRAALDCAYQHFSDHVTERILGAEQAAKEAASWHVKAFTDNIVIGYPIFAREPDAEAELGSLLLAIRDYQLEMTVRGFFLRGGVSIGELYMDDEIVFGDALIEAYETEQRVARDPRIVISKSAQGYVRQHFGFYGHPAYSPHDEVMLKDTDGQLFVNYLGATYDDDPESPDWSKISQHRIAVEGSLEKFRENPPIWSKYAWVANYHNFLCEEQGGRFLEHKIQTERLRTHPERLHEGWAPPAFGLREIGE